MHEQNRRSWNAVTSVHNRHKNDQSGFLAGGGSTLFPDELELLGDLSGRRLVHLQCNCGQDTLSLSRLAGRVVGVDISDDAIAFARQLSRDSGLSAEFVRSDLFDWFDETEERFDVAFSSYGTIGWLCDLNRWAGGVAEVLVPGGQLVLLEFHPLAWSLQRDGLTGDSYFLRDPIHEKSGVNDYVGEALAPSGYQQGNQDWQNPETAYSFQWTVGDIVTSVARAGLVVETLREYEYANGCEIFDGMKLIEGRRYTVPDSMASVPLMLGLRARLP